MKYIYYAHPKCYYGSLLEAQDMLLINDTFACNIANPSDPYQQKNWALYGMPWFDKHYLPVCDALVYRNYVGWHEVGAGVGYEIQAMLKANKPVYQIGLNGEIVQIFQCPDILPKEVTSALNQKYRRQV